MKRHIGKIKPDAVLDCFIFDFAFTERNAQSEYNRLKRTAVHALIRKQQGGKSPPRSSPALRVFRCPLCGGSAPEAMIKICGYPVCCRSSEERLPVVGVAGAVSDPDFPE